MWLTGGRSLFPTESIVATWGSPVARGSVDRAIFIVCLWAFCLVANKLADISGVAREQLLLVVREPIPD